MRARRKNLIDQVMAQHARLTGEDQIARQVYKAHLEQFSDEQIAEELKKLKEQI